MSFSQHKKSPFIVGVVRNATVGEDIATILNSEVDGADAIDVHLHFLRESERSDENLTRLFKSTDLPILALYYREQTAYNNPPAPESERLAKLVRAVELGAAGVDIQADTFDPDSKSSLKGSIFEAKQPCELSLRPDVIERQKALIDEIHAKGGEVLMSAHVWVKLSREEGVALAKEIESRGADVVKIVSTCGDDDYEHAVEMLATIEELKRVMKKPFVYLGTGKAGRITRIVGATLGNCLVFANQRYESYTTQTQPLISSARTVLKELSRDVRK